MKRKFSPKTWNQVLHDLTLDKSLQSWQQHNFHLQLVLMKTYLCKRELCLDFKLQKTGLELGYMAHFLVYLIKISMIK